MSTTTVDAVQTHTGSLARAMVVRFAWKEFRMLRGLWLAAVVLGAIVQCAIDVLSPPSAEQLFSAALAAAALYAVGAAAITLSVEHEEETYDFLAGLPVRWWPMYEGKLSMVTVSAVALACALSVIGWLLGGYARPTERQTAVALGMFGVAIFEAIAWGMLFSSLLKRPIVVVIFTLVVGAVAVNVVVLLSSPFAAANLNATEYSDAAPQRLGLVALVLAASAAVARRWLPMGPSSDRARGFWAVVRRQRVWRSTGAGAADRATSTAREGRRRALARLVWQSLRDAGKLLALPILIAAFLVGGAAAANVLLRPSAAAEKLVWLSTALFVPALYGALAFSADQRRGQHRFLAEHAAPPRYVWLARHIVWLGTLMALSVAVWLAGNVVVAVVARLAAMQDLADYLKWGRLSQNGPELASGTSYVINGAGIAWCGILASYGVGQLCSMVIRSEILAAFLALVLSVVITAWGAVLFAWQLSGWLFLLPVAAAMMLATWLRAPDWIAGRNNWRAWLAPALVVIATLGLVGVALPFARLAQVPDYAVASARHFADFIEIEHRAGDTSESRATAAMYLRAVELLQGGSAEEAETAAVKLAIDASERPTCRFEFDNDQFAEVLIWGGQLPGLDRYPLYRQVNALLEMVWKVEPGEPFDRLLAALRMSAHLRSDQPSVVFMDRLENEKAILAKIGGWAAHEGRTKEELESAADQLNAHFETLPSLSMPLMADHLLVADVLVGNERPFVLTQSPNSPWVHLAYLANELPWERKRASLALNEITRYHVAEAEGLVEYLSSSDPNDVYNNIRRWVRPLYGPAATKTWMIAQPSAATSYLARLEYEARVPVHMLFRAYCDNQTFRRAALLQVALAKYRLDQGKYPSKLMDLVPEYLENLPVDPYSRQPFEYEVAGLDLPLKSWGNGANFDRIEANTPLFWSVGAGNATVKRFHHATNDENNVEGASSGVGEIVYLLASDELEWSGDPVFAFPLRK
jgi:hypothetical protein